MRKNIPNDIINIIINYAIIQLTNKLKQEIINYKYHKFKKNN